MAAFLDSNILVYAFGTDRKADRSREVLYSATDLGVQTLNEFANVSLRKGGRNWGEVAAHLAELYLLFPNPVPLNEKVHRDGVRLCQRYGFSLWDGMMVAAALQSRSDVLWSEDMHHGLIVDDRLRVVNPFAPVH